MKEIKEIFRFTLYAQPVPEALSVISVNFCVTFPPPRQAEAEGYSLVQTTPPYGHPS